MEIKAIKTQRVEKQTDLKTFLDASISNLEENCVLAITSKIISICEGRLVPKESISKMELIRQEADCLLQEDDNAEYPLVLTLKNHLLIPSAGIDESNIQDAYLLYPKAPFESAQKIGEYLRKKHAVKNLGILITDSHTTPLRRGVTGIALAWWGFQPLYSYIGKPDLFNQTLRVTNINIVDALAASAVFNMGEGNESTPLAILKDIPKITFNNTSSNPQDVCIPPEEDIYKPFLSPLLTQLASGK